MADEIRDLDDVESQAWATIYAAWSTFAHESAEGHADNGVRLLRERRHTRPHDEADRITLGERDKVVAWLRAEGERAEARSGHDYLQAAVICDAIERGEHDR